MIPKRSIQSDALDEGKERTMSIEENVQVVKDFFAAIGSGDKRRVLTLVAEDIEWIVSG
jgi:ketosteroid isomerase-like protein